VPLFLLSLLNPGYYFTGAASFFSAAAFFASAFLSAAAFFAFAFFASSQIENRNPLRIGRLS
jgi:hypothetical protein